MANVATVIAMEPTYQPYERPPDPFALWTAIPRGLRGFFIQDGVVDAKPVNDTQTLQLQGTLPSNFAYVFAEVGLHLQISVAGDWDGTYTLNLDDWYQGRTLQMFWNFPFELLAFLAQNQRGQGNVSNSQVPKAPMWAIPNSDGLLINIQAFNASPTVAGTGTCSAYINFWEFDLEQARKFPINAPLPVHTR